MAFGVGKKILMKKVILYFLFIFLVIRCQKNAENNYLKENFTYSVTATAPKSYPCEVHIGYLADDKKQLICGIPKTGIENGGWQYDGSKGGMGGNEIPSYINLTYVAYAEKKFYHLEADLPKEKMLDAFRKGFLIEGTEKDENGVYELIPSTYSTITAAIAPGGMVVIFLGGSDRIEICRLQAKETIVDVNNFYQNADNENNQQFFDSWFKLAVPDSIQTQIRENGLPYKLYDDYRKRYNYRFTFKPYDEKDVVRMQTNRYYNGEVTDFLQPEEIAKKEYRKQSIPYQIAFIFKKYNAEIEFNDKEMLTVFEALQNKHPGKPMDILVVPTFMYTDIKLSVKCEDETVPLTKYIVKNIWGG